MLDAVLCELEGVLADTELLRQQALQRSFAEEYLQLTAATYATHCIGLPVETAVRAGLRALSAEHDDTAVELLTLRATRYFMEVASRGLMLAPGAGALVEEAQGKTRLAIVTRASRRETELILSLAQLEGAFECVLTAEDGIFPKPSPAIYARALERLARRRAVQVERIVALEYGRAGIHAAHAAGLRCIAVGTLPPHVQIEADTALPSLAHHTLVTLEAFLSTRKETVG
jgi:beta-phosphoglucomutase-like phosphatase (HAD superfamily)